MPEQKSGLFWHIHHDKLVGWTDNIDERIAYIKNNKPSNEIETRLRLMKPVKGKLPYELVKAVKACYKADKVWDKAVMAWDMADKAWEKAYKAWDKADRVWEKYKPEIEALHKKECGCKEWDGTRCEYAS